jgi:hypothetical protein
MVSMTGPYGRILGFLDRLYTVYIDNLINELEKNKMF